MTAKVHTMTGQTHATYNTRQAAYDLRKLLGKQLVGKPARTRRYYLPGPAARTISARPQPDTARCDARRVASPTLSRSPCRPRNLDQY